MGSETKIEWCDSTFNPWIGCAKVSPGCDHCYAAQFGKRLGVEWGAGKPRRRTSPSTWRQPLAWERKTANLADTECDCYGSDYSGGVWDPHPVSKHGYTLHSVFCGSLCDWLDLEVPAEWLADLLALIVATPHLAWLMLTKRPELWEERVRHAQDMATEDEWDEPQDAWVSMVTDWLNGHAPPNVWVGATAEDQRRADERIPTLLKIPAAKRFLSCEPLLGPVDLEFTGSGRCPSGSWESCPSLCDGCNCRSVGIHWVIVGGESGPGARPMHPDWARSLRDQCQAAGVPFFFKQAIIEGRKVSTPELDGKRWTEVPR